MDSLSLEPNVNLHARLREREEATAVAGLDVRTKHFLEEMVHRSLQVPQVKLTNLVNPKNLDLSHEQAAGLNEYSTTVIRPNRAPECLGGSWVRLRYAEVSKKEYMIQKDAFSVNANLTRSTRHSRMATSLVIICDWPSAFPLSFVPTANLKTA